ncbi:RNA polymerase sigma factor [Phocaeicola oris]|uniref:RNA polymerase sigma factor n=1 Tax=Phocaeicola oris TaxID=2896850 RepID=UPI00234FA61C|nr:sigma-70 family RNA polymerase sigma factor [Phocaeicola oris]MCE2615841.1 sigma-70 family RNA polymerase sigma factor [Phocaeicola oris]
MVEESKLIVALKSGSTQALSKIYQLYAKRLYSFCLQYSKSSQDAEEIVEDVFIRLWNIRSSIRQEETLCKLLFIMSRRLLINAYRRRVNEPIYADYVEAYNIVDEAHNERWIEFEEFKKRLDITIRKLPKTQQQVIKLSRLQGMSIREIAVYMRLSEQTVKNQLSQGLHTLRTRLIGLYGLSGVFYFCIKTSLLTFLY